MLDLPTSGEDLEPWVDALTQMFMDEPLGRAREVDVLLGAPLAEVRSLTDLPPVSERDLHDLVANQRSKFFRNGHGSVALAATWVDSGEQRAARIAQCDLVLMEAIEACAARSGRVVRRFFPVDGAGRAGPVLLTPDGHRRMRRRRRRWVAAWLTAATAGWAATGGVYLYDLASDSRATSADLAALQAPLQRIDALTRRVEEFGVVAQAYRRNALDSTWLQSRLARVVTALPEHTHLHRLIVERTGAVVLEAHGPDPVAVVDDLSSAGTDVVRLEGVPRPDAWDGVPTGQRFTVLVDAAP